MRQSHSHAEAHTSSNVYKPCSSLSTTSTATYVHPTDVQRNSPDNLCECYYQAHCSSLEACVHCLPVHMWNTSKPYISHLPTGSTGSELLHHRTDSMLRNPEQAPSNTPLAATETHDRQHLHLMHSLLQAQCTWAKHTGPPQHNMCKPENAFT